MKGYFIFMRGLIRVGVAAVSLILMTWVLVGAQPIPAQSVRLAELDVLSRLNKWRISENLSPLSENKTLAEMALYHARYLSRLSSIPDGSAIHRDAQGHGVFDRARYPEFQWPNYGRADQIVITEIAAVNTVIGALNFWNQSMIHNRSVVNPVYREVGIAAIERGFGRYIIVVVMGAQPNVLPATYNPEDGRIYLTNENYRFISGANILKSVEKVRLFDGVGRTLTGWMPWAATLTLPANITGRISILYWDEDLNIQTLGVVDFDRNVAWVPGYVPTATPTPTNTPTPLPTAPLITNTPTLTPTPTYTPTPTTPPPPELLLIYDNVSFTIVNTSGRNLDLSAIHFEGAGAELYSQWWLGPINASLLARIPRDTCLITYVSALSPSAPPPPAECARVTATRGRLSTTQRFWLGDTFTVLQRDNTAGTCTGGEGRCIVDLP